MRSANHRRRGFTLMEVLLVMAIIVILGSFVGAYFVGIQKRSLTDAAKTQINSFKTPLQTYRLDVGLYPEKLDDLILAPANLQDSGKWRGPYLEKEVPRDPWGHDYTYQNNGDTYTISSFGPDGNQGGNDDVSN